MPDNNEELVIIRRRSAFAEADFKSGVWKIAYADFMTAMMAFFLVMWLLNATNQETRESVASYFNPIKLSESTPDRKGVNDPQKAQPEKAEPDGEENKPAEAGPPPPPPAAAPTPPNKPGPGTGQPVESSVARPPRFDEAALFRDPYAVLTDIAGGPASTAKRERRIGISLGSPDHQGTKDGEAYRDPFDPIYWQIAPKASIERRNSGAGERGSLPADEDLAALVDGEARKPPEGRLDVTVTTSGYQPDSTGPAAHKPAGEASPAVSAASAASAASASQSPPPTPTPPPPQTPSQTQPPPAEPVAATPPAPPSPPAGAAPDKPATEKAAVETAASDAAAIHQAEAAALEASLRAAVANGPKPGPAVAVEHTDEGLLLSLTDSANFGMFAIGSAEPQSALVRTIDRIGPVLSGRTGTIVVRGHTDARPFRSQNYDNWRLSTARAHMAYHMLVRAGVEPSRIERIEGHADRRLKQPNDPFAAPNRRIEILIKSGRP
jgi:chemotaxis protein MotB